MPQLLSPLLADAVPEAVLTILKFGFLALVYLFLWQVVRVVMLELRPASVGGRSKNIIATIGDGSVPMNVQELETIKNYKINVKIFVFNNRGYSLIKQTQETWLDGRYSGVNKESGLNLPNNLKIANSYGIKSIYIKNNNELKKKLFSIINTRGPVLVDLNIDPSCRVEPKLDYGSALHDMSPKLPKEEITNNMIS